MLQRGSAASDCHHFLCFSSFLRQTWRSTGTAGLAPNVSGYRPHVGSAMGNKGKGRRPDCSLADWQLALAGSDSIIFVQAGDVSRAPVYVRVPFTASWLFVTDHGGCMCSLVRRRGNRGDDAATPAFCDAFPSTFNPPPPSSSQPPPLSSSPPVTSSFFGWVALSRWRHRTPSVTRPFQFELDLWNTCVHTEKHMRANTNRGLATLHGQQRWMLVRAATTN